MKDPFTAALSDVIQNQIELTSTIESLLDQSLSHDAGGTNANEIQSRLDNLNTHVDALVKRLAAKHDQDRE
ncbi:hypothetical protein [Pseudomonas sp. NPDC090208]|uniref:hypothetical protein n=1 Tax=Pseudomonas sp. NPDC090208 TaxID=3364478 RepID=UPI003828B302